MKSIKEYISTENILEFKARRGNTQGNIPTKEEIIDTLDRNGFARVADDLDSYEVIGACRAATRSHNTPVYSTGKYYGYFIDSHWIRFCFPGESVCWFMRDIDAIKKIERLPDSSQYTNFATIVYGDWKKMTYEEFSEKLYKEHHIQF